MPSVQLHRDHSVYGHSRYIGIPTVCCSLQIADWPAESERLGVFLAVFMTSWLTIDYTIYDVGTRSITFMMLAGAGLAYYASPGRPPGS